MKKKVPREEEGRAPTVYISGPSTGYKDCNVKAFAAAEAYLLHLGFEVMNPLTPEDTPFPEDGKVDDAKWLGYIIRDIRLIAHCDCVYFLPGSEHSFGSQIERMVAVRFRKVQMEHTNWTYAGDKDEEE